MQSIFVSSGKQDCKVDMHAVLCGQDLNVAVCGGTKPHVGACALSVPRESLQDASRRSASESVLCVLAHKDDELAKNIAHSLAAQFGCVACVSVGLHVDNAGKSEIQQLLHNAQDALAQLTAKLQECGFASP